MFIEAERDPEVPDSTDRACWCALTAGAIGPDGRLVSVEDCRPGRACHEPR